MDFVEIRSHVIVALLSDAVLVNRLVLKGGNALELVHGIVTRGSIDLDFSIEGDFDNVEDTRERIFFSLRARFERVGHLVFDESFEVKPPTPSHVDPWWGGYQAEFKLIDRALADSLGGKIENMRRQAQTIDTRHTRRFRVDISKHEYCEGKIPATFDGHEIYVYSEEMCAIEKLRAICQQMPEYEKKTGQARARDFYDIYATVTKRGLDLSLPENLELFRNIFAAKRVPLEWLPRIVDTRDFHKSDWDSVRATVEGEVFNFDIYFDYVVELVSKLHALWDK